MFPGKDLPEFLSAGSDGLIAIAGHRIGLEDIVYYYNEGYSPEMLKGQFPSLPLAVIFKTIGFYLENRDATDAYAEQLARRVEEQRAAASLNPNREELLQRVKKSHPSKAS